MALETRTTLNEATRDQLQRLIQINIDSSQALDKLASNTKVIAVANLFRSLSVDRAKQADGLQRIVESNGDTSCDAGSVAGSVRRTLIDIRAALGGDESVMLGEAEKWEDQIKSAYEDALRKESTAFVSDVIRQQYADVKTAHSRVRDLRDAYQDS